MFVKEPPPADHPLLLLDEVIVTPHLGASTAEAQEGVAFTAAEQMRDYLLSGALRGAVNVPALGTRELAVLRPDIDRDERLGRLQAQFIGGAVREVKLEFAGDIVELNAAPVTRSFLAGLLRDVSARVNAVNAFLIAEERGIGVTTSYLRATSDFVPSIRARVVSNAAEQSLAGTIFGFGEQAREGRITEIDGFLHRGDSAGAHAGDAQSRRTGRHWPGGDDSRRAWRYIGRFHLGRRREVAKQWR